MSIYCWGSFFNPDHAIFWNVVGQAHIFLGPSFPNTVNDFESIFFFLAPILRPQRIFLFGEVAGVLDSAGQVLRRITPESLAEVEAVTEAPPVVLDPVTADDVIIDLE